VIRRLVIREEALEEIDEAAAWYRNESLESSPRFLDTVAAAVDAVRLHPYRYPVRGRGVRHLVLPIFPYSIIYVADDQEVVIVLCFHHRRDPEEWRRRI
jgi:plasmid stabilization system protein ParE